MPNSYWNHIYEHFDPVAFHIFSLPVHWYGMMYVLALISALAIGKYFLKEDRYDFTPQQIDSYFIYVEIGVILGARLGYILFYDPHTWYYITHPWQIFNPFFDGHFVGIRGMSYHGALIGFLLGTYIYSKRYNVNFGKIMDLVSISIPLAYVFGRIGNFLNQELIGRQTDLFFGIYVNGVLRHPSQLYEALLEGVGVFLIVYFYRRYQKFNGELLLIYGMAYGFLRGVCEFFRAPDPQIGYLCCNTVTLGMLLSFFMFLLGFILWIYYRKVR